jgi:hypothetical protein
MGVKPKHIKMSSDVFASAGTGTIYDFTAAGQSRTDPAYDTKGGKKVVKWGTDNLLPYHLRQILAENDIKQQLINTDVDLACGKGLIFYKEIDDDENGVREVVYVKDDDLQQWLEDWDIEAKFHETMLDLKEFGNSWIEFLFARDLSRVNSCASLDAVDCRIRKPDKDNWKIDTLLVADWKYRSLTEANIKTVPLIKKDWSDFGKKSKQAYHLKLNFSGQPFYTLVEWFGSRIWAEVSNLIPKFHRSGLKGGFSLRYHVKIPISYLEDRVAAMKKDEITEVEAVQKVKLSILTEIDAVIGGAENAQKAFFSWINDHIPSPTGWEIVKIDTDLKDDSYIALSDAADKKHARGHNIHPVLAGIETSGSLSSGSEILNLLNFHTSYKTPRFRKLVLKAFNKILQKNYPEKWQQGIRLGVEDVQLTTLDKNPTGKQNTTAS